jgi:hypothetical protein
MEASMTNNTQTARLRCPCCNKKFIPDPRVGARQKYCSNKTCQNKRQRFNEQAWTTKPKNKKFLKLKRKKWRKRNPDYLSKWRASHPESVQSNREYMQEYQRRKRQSKVFEKTKECALQVAKNKGVVYASRGKTWILMRLKRPLTSTKDQASGYASKQVSKAKIRRPQGRLYNLLDVLGGR